jgi:hypothetical protein
MTTLAGDLNPVELQSIAIGYLHEVAGLRTKQRSAQ